MVSINTALQIDLTGQVCSDSLGYRIYSGLGGQVDFIRGAAMSKGGKPIIAIPSTVEGGAKSTIVPCIEEGTGVVTTRGDVHYIVTEYGVAFLHGKSIRERAMGLIEIAHPKFRGWLLDEAKKHKFIYADQQLKSGAIYPEQYEKWETLPDGLKVFFRPVKPTDEKGLQRLIYRMSRESRYLRFFQNLSRFPHRKAQELTMMDYSGEMALAAIVSKDEGEEIVAAGQYLLNSRSGMAEVAFMIRDDYQGRKLGTSLLRYLIKIARENGVKGFFADVLLQNKAMMKVFLNCGYEANIEPMDGDYRVTFTFDKPSKTKPA
jgi:RimJ/RimL family protein N-acetyltransferase